MDVVHKLMNPFNTDTSGQFKETEWNKCFICQEDKSEVLRCPADSKREEKGTGYKTISDLLVRFSNAGCLPRTINLARLDDAGGVEATLVRHKARFHESCRLKFNKTKLQRAEKRKIEPADNANSSMKFTRQNVVGNSSVNSKAICFFL